MLLAFLRKYGGDVQASGNNEANQNFIHEQIKTPLISDMFPSTHLQ